MAQLYEDVTIKGQGITLSQLVWRQEKAPSAGRVEEILAANRHLADAGFILPVGTVVRIPAKAAEVENQPLAPIQLW